MDPYSTTFRSAFEQTDSEYSFVDFLPQCQQGQGFFTQPIYDDFRSLVNRANDWLSQHPEWDITTCESIELKANSDNIKPERMIYTEYGHSTTWYIRGLRLWIKRCPARRERVKQIGYFNLIPFERSPGGFLSEPVYESLDEVITRYNDPQQTTPIQGHVITVETQVLRLTHGCISEPDRCSWMERGQTRDRFVFILRIFFDVTQPKHEVIGIANFCPEPIKTSFVAVWNLFEPFSNVVQRASEWMTQYPQTRVCNVQSVVTKAIDGKFADPLRMSYVEYGNAAQCFIRYLRIAHVTSRVPNEAPHSNQFTCMNFVPMQLSAGGLLMTSGSMPQFETLQDTVKRASDWLRAAGADVVSFETSAVRFSERKGADCCADQTFGYSPQNQNEYFFYVIRAFIRGTYSGEDVGVPLPVVTEFQGRCCTIL